MKHNIDSISSYIVNKINLTDAFKQINHASLKSTISSIMIKKPKPSIESSASEIFDRMFEKVRR